MRREGMIGLGMLACLAVGGLQAAEKGLFGLFSDSLEGVEPGLCSSAAWSGQSGTVQLGEPPAVRRYAGRCGFRVSAETLGHLLDETPSGEPDYSARFAVFTGSSGLTEIFRAENSLSQTVFTLSYDAGNQRISLQSGASSENMPASSAPANRWVVVALSYSDSGSLQVRTTHRGTAVTSSAISASGLSVDRVLLGALSEVNGAGTLDFDDFESTRSVELLAGSCRGDANGDTQLNVFDSLQITNERLGQGLAVGQPDCTEDGLVNVFDRVCVTARNLNTEVCP